MSNMPICRYNIHTELLLINIQFKTHLRNDNCPLINTLMRNSRTLKVDQMSKRTACLAWPFTQKRTKHSSSSIRIRIRNADDDPHPHPHPHPNPQLTKFLYILKNRNSFYFSTQNNFECVEILYIRTYRNYIRTTTYKLRSNCIRMYRNYIFGKETCEAQLVIITKRNILHLSVASGEIDVEIASYLPRV